jgi:cytochrome c oxidase subunit 2
MRALTPAVVSALLLLSACGSNTASVLDDEAMEHDGAMEHSEGMMEEDGEAMQPGAVVPPADEGAMVPADVRVIEMEATDWAFSPSAISVKQGEKIVIRVKGVEGKHSIAIPDLDINVEINPGETKDIEIPTDKAGTFAFRCRIPCGPGHKDMTGTLVIS